MEFIWEDRLSVGVELIDEQHREMLKRGKDLIEAIRQGRGSDEINKLMGFLEDYIFKHFSAEEKLMLDVEYPKHQEHRQHHMEFIQMFASIRFKFMTEGGTPDYFQQVGEYMRNWMEEHIGGVDRELGEYIRQYKSTAAPA